MTPMGSLRLFSLIVFSLPFFILWLLPIISTEKLIQSDQIQMRKRNLSQNIKMPVIANQIVSISCKSTIYEFIVIRILSN